MTTETDKTERERFEAWWDNPGPCDEALKGVSWQAWQARAALDTDAVPVLQHDDPIRRWIEAAMTALMGYELDYGEALPPMHEIGRIDESRASASFRFTVQHFRQLHATLTAAPQPPASAVVDHEQRSVSSNDACVSPVSDNSASVSAEEEPVAWQWRGLYEDGNPRTAWYPDGAHEMSLWEDYERESGKCVVEKRPLYTAPPAQPVAVSVKPLEWPQKDPTYDAALTALGTWWVIRGKYGWAWRREEDAWSPPFPTESAAKSAAQADYEQRIRSALVVEPSQSTPVCCIACEDHPQAPNDPCAVCGKSSRPKPLDVDALAQEIRRVDGSHKLGAGALAEALMPFLSARAALAAQEKADGEWGRPAGAGGCLRRVRGRPTRVHC